MPTGSGKTVVFSHILKRMHDKGKHGLMVVRGRQLVDQASDRLKRENVPHGVIMNGRQSTLGQQLYVCSIDTLQARGITPKADIIVIDEAHQAACKSYIDLVGKYPDAYYLGVTATPFTKKPLTHIATAVIRPITMAELIVQGFLVPPRYFVPVDHDLSDISTRNGDYDKNELADFFSKSKIIGDIVDHWVKYGNNRPTILFAASVPASKSIVDRFSAAGIPALHVEAETPDCDRAFAIAELQSGSVKVISNVNILCTGVDIPAVSCLVMARPTKSIMLYLQQAGRATRPAPGKSDFILIDHANNVKEHGFIDMEREIFLEGMPKSKKSNSAPFPIKTCPECYAVVAITTTRCAECGHVFNVDVDKAKQGELRLATKADLFDIEVKGYIKELRRKQKARGYKWGWLYHQLKEKYGHETASRYLPKRVVPDWVHQKLTPS